MVCPKYCRFCSIDKYDYSAIRDKFWKRGRRQAFNIGELTEVILHAISNIRHTVKYAVKVRFIVVVNRLYCENVLKLLIKADEAKADNILQSGNAYTFAAILKPQKQH